MAKERTDALIFRPPNALEKTSDGARDIGFPLIPKSIDYLLKLA